MERDKLYPIIDNRFKLCLKLYSFTESFEEIEKLVRKRKTLPKTFETKGYYNKKATFRKILKLLTNTRETLKIAILEDGSWIILTKDSNVADIHMLDVSYSTQPRVFPEVKEGYYLITSKSYYSSERLVCLTDCQKLEETQEWLRLYQSIEALYERYRHTNEFQNKSILYHDGTVTREMLKEKLKEFQELAEEVEEAEKEERRKLKEAFQNKVKITQTEKTTKIWIDALDNHIYEVEISPPIKIKKEKFKDYIYLHRYHQSNLNYIQKSTFWSSLWDWLSELTNKTLKVKIDNTQPVEILFQEQVNKLGLKSITTYCNKKRVSRYDLNQSLYDYFYDGQPLVIKPTNISTIVPEDHAKALRLKKERELLEKGLTGRLYDLEGEIPVKLLFKKEGKKWYLTIGEYEYHLKGGKATIKKLESVLKGTAQTYRARYSTEELYTRLSDILGEEDALQILEAIKEYGKLLQALEKK